MPLGPRPPVTTDPADRLEAEGDPYTTPTKSSLENTEPGDMEKYSEKKHSFCGIVLFLFSYLHRSFFSNYYLLNLAALQLNLQTDKQPHN